MLALFQTLLDIIRLRKGPDAIPYSWLLLLLSLVLWLFAALVTTLMFEELTDQDYIVGTFVGVVGLACYATLVVTTGHTPRLLQVLTAVLGCGALISLLFVAGRVFLAPVTGTGPANFVATLILLWSVPVEGHIMARAIDRHWYVGIVVAMAVFIFQFYLLFVLDPTPAAA
jgi:hypothetical protein